MQCLQDVHDCSINFNRQVGKKNTGTLVTASVCISNFVHTTTEGVDATGIIWNANNNCNQLCMENRLGGFDAKSRESRRTVQRELDRRRTDALNIAYTELRALLPHIPRDTKLTKLRTLLGAIAYIKQLIALIHNNNTDSYSNSQNFCFSYSWMPEL
nr:heart and neural crest derivatives expressed,dhand [Hymenolepis microstoma]